MGLRPIETFLLLSRGDRLKTSESDFYRGEILTSKVDPGALGVKPNSQYYIGGFAPLGLKACICQFTKCQIRPLNKNFK